ncbi:TetR family transcriptional regulator [Streptomyces sp. P6-2-1]|uniref:TetR family transcriptional regulator n=1 Tax=Streptomyces sp. P6-2-1 TaxID=3422591 RepID=UPI003D35B15B
MGDRDTAQSATTERHREWVLAAALELLKKGGRDTVSTRAVSTDAGVQAPTLHRLFGTNRACWTRWRRTGGRRIQERSGSRPE